MSPAGRRLCAHADEDGRGMHFLEPGERCDRLRPGESPDVNKDWRDLREWLIKALHDARLRSLEGQVGAFSAALDFMDERERQPPR